MNERLRPSPLKKVLRFLATYSQGVFSGLIDLLRNRGKQGNDIFIQDYYPTRKLLHRLKNTNDIRVSLAHFSSYPGFRKYLTDRLIPIYGFSRSYKQKSDQLYDFYVKNRSARLILSNGVDITEPIYRVIDQKVLEFLPSTLLKLNCIINYIDKFPLKLVILISNLGSVASLVHCVAKSRAIPSYMIINGMLGMFLRRG